MGKPRLIVEVKARIEWIDEPKDIKDAAMREYANIKAAKAGRQLTPAVQLLVAELLSVQVPD